MKRMMKRKKSLIIISLTATVFVIIIILLFAKGILIYNGINAGIGLPDIETISRIELNGKVYDNYNEINEIMSVLYEVNAPVITSFLFWTKAANDGPPHNTQLSIFIYYGAVISYQAYLINSVIYVPYMGVYDIQQSTIEKLHQWY